MSHTGEIAGGERSLLAAIPKLADDVNISAAAPVGALTDALRAVGIEVSPIAGMRLSLRRSVASTVGATPAAIGSIRALRDVVRRVRPDVVHANSLRAGILCAAAGVHPLVVSVRDALPRSARARFAQRFVASHAAVVIANSRFTADRFEAATGREPFVLHPPIDVHRHADSDQTHVRARLGVPSNAPLVAVVGQVTPWKGQLEAIEAFSLVRQRHPAAQLLIVGESKFAGGRFDNAGYAAALRGVVARAGMAADARFLGEREDIAEILAAVDVLLVPSWEEPFGRVVVEGMAAGCAVVATSSGGPAEVIENGIDGFLVGPRRTTDWAAVVSRLLDEPRARAAVGDAAAMAAKRFGVVSHARQLLEVYKEMASPVSRDLT